MMEMSEEAIEALEEQARAAGFEDGYQRGYYAAKVEIDDGAADIHMGLNDENARLKEQVARLENTVMVKASIIESQRAAIEALENKLKDAEKLHRADLKHIEELHDAIEPKQQQIHQLNGQVNNQRELINELRQAILKHVKETMR